MSTRVAFGLVFVGFCIALVRLRPRSNRTFVAKLHDPNVDVRRAAVHTLVEHPVNDERVIAELSKSAF